ncbi:hypothetical protein AXF42_Ash009799 [Apostasia shenzhenica]|uniref:Uncharacterized protein n=1 Tax=Apostasia shenzhenica TaxID=1088818 RepID=A0A2I0AX43_9ASPA|nr:hypothetical protein AXF42_Ash009799 [Apostasia shenzhenica]
MHAKTDSDLTSLAASSPPRSPRRPIYYVMSPSNPDVEKLSLAGLSPAASPFHHHHHPHHHRYASSPIHHSRESSTTRFSASLKHGPWRKLPHGALHLSGPAAGDDEDDDDEEESDEHWGFRCYAVLFLMAFFVLFGLFSLILWAASKAYAPKIAVKSVMFESYNIQAGVDHTGVATKMMTINSTVRISFRNPATFFGVHVSSTPLELRYYDLLIASGRVSRAIAEFYSSRKSGRVVATAVSGKEISLYGGGSDLSSHGGGSDLSSHGGVGPSAAVPLSLTFVVRARANVLGELVRSRFYRRVRCSVYLRESRLGRPADIRRACRYD